MLEGFSNAQSYRRLLKFHISFEEILASQNLSDLKLTFRFRSSENMNLPKKTIVQIWNKNDLKI